MLVNNYDSLSRTTTDWIIWSSFIAFFSLILIISFVFFTMKYIKQKRNVFELWKISILSIFMGIFLIQSFISFPMIDGIIPFGLDDVVVIVIGFMIGPIEAILFGFITDTTKTFINGWTYQLLPALIYPLTGLIAGIFGEIYRTNLKRKKDVNNSELKVSKKLMSFDFISFQVITLLFVLFTMITPTFIRNDVYEDFNKILVLTSSIVLFTLLEITFIYLMFFSKKETTFDIKILLYVTISIILTRIITGWVIRPFSMYFYYGYDLQFQVISRIATSSYLVPIKIIISYWVIKLFKQYYRNIQ